MEIFSSSLFLRLHERKKEEFACMIVRVSNPNKNHPEREREMGKGERHFFDIFSPYLSTTTTTLNTIFSKLIRRKEREFTTRRRMRMKTTSCCSCSCSCSS